MPLQLVEENSRSGMTMQETIAYEKLRSFCANIMKKVAPPFLQKVQASNVRPEAVPLMPKGMTRAVKRNASASAVKPKPTENVLLQALGLVPKDMIVDDGAAQVLEQLFDSLLRAQHVDIITALFGKTVLPPEELVK
ncbi:hypothetical protein ZWY2020_007791 [Hordeum vulgare]|nr:hypothetical protein ZWY2020_007791 [Hordeum vulgare]